MDYDDWLRAGNGARRNESLEDAVGRTVGSAWDFPAACPECGSEDITCPNNNNIWSCESCDYTWVHN